MASIGGITIPANIANGGTYLPSPPATRKNGLGILVEYGGASVDWSWDVLTQSDFLWWVTTLLGGQRSKSFTSAQLYDDRYTLRTYSNCVVERPTFQTYRAGLVMQARVLIRDLLV